MFNGALTQILLLALAAILVVAAFVFTSVPPSVIDTDGHAPVRPTIGPLT